MEIDLKQIISESYSLREVIQKLGWSDSGHRRRQLKRLVEEQNLSTKHFNPNIKKKKYERVTKVCPVCKSSFTTKKHPIKEGVTCSKSCAATWFRTGSNHPNWKGTQSYREYCFSLRGHKCAVCDEQLILDVHHMDENHGNNHISNLVPMCPTHHRYMHSKHRDLIQPKLDLYLQNMVIEA